MLHWILHHKYLSVKTIPSYKYFLHSTPRFTTKFFTLNNLCYYFVPDLWCEPHHCGSFFVFLLDIVLCIQTLHSVNLQNLKCHISCIDVLLWQRESRCLLEWFQVSLRWRWCGSEFTQPVGSSLPCGCRDPQRCAMFPRSVKRLVFPWGWFSPFVSCVGYRWQYLGTRVSSPSCFGAWSSRN